MKTGQRIREKRRDRGLTQAQVADYFDIKPPSVSEWESGRSSPEVEKLPALARLLGTSVAYLLTGKEGPADQGVELVQQDDSVTVDEIYDLLAAFRVSGSEDRKMIVKSAKLAAARAGRNKGKATGS